MQQGDILGIQHSSTCLHAKSLRILDHFPQVEKDKQPRIVHKEIIDILSLGAFLI